MLAKLTFNEPVDILERYCKDVISDTFTET